MSASNKIYLITGASRGIGLEFTRQLLLRPSTTIICATRDPSSTASQSILSLPTGDGSRALLIPSNVPWPPADPDSPTDPSTTSAISDLATTHDISHIDVLIANAGISLYYGAGAGTPLNEVRRHFEVNTVGSLAVFQAAWPLLQKCPSGKPVFVGIASSLGSIGDLESRWALPVMAYAMSKAALNMLVRRLAFEEKDKGLVALAMDPGWVQTEAGNFGAKFMGMEKAFLTPEESITGMLEKIDRADEEMSGKFLCTDDSPRSW